jgi:protein transport protein SEC61 subunit gamma-like protein
MEIRHVNLSDCDDSVDEFLFQFLTRCTKPSQQGLLSPVDVLLLFNTLASEFSQICKAVAIGFGVMGFIGYFVKLIHIPM